MPAITTIKLRRGTAAQWTSANSVLASGEEGHESDTGKRKVGDGATAWNSLAYFASGAVSSVNGQVGVVDLSGLYAAAAPPAGIGPNLLGYDASRGVYNLKESHLRRTRAACGKARGGSGYCNGAILSDSTGAGTGASNVATKSWPAQMEAILVASGVPSSGSGMVPWWKNSTPADPRLTIGAGWTQLQGDTNLLINSTTTNPLTFVSTNVGTIVRVMYYALSGPFTVTIDGGSPVTVTPSGADAPAVYAVTGLANTVHTVAVARSSGTCFQHAVEVANGTSGLRIYNASVGGNTIQYLANIAGAIGFGFPQVAAATAGFNADLMILDCEINDAIVALALATFKSRWQAAITLARTNGADVVIKTSTPGSGLTLTGYTQQLYDLADSNDLPLIDVQPRWGSYATANALGLMADTFHPSDAGYADEATAVVRALGLTA